MWLEWIAPTSPKLERATKAVVPNKCNAGSVLSETKPDMVKGSWGFCTCEMFAGVCSPGPEVCELQSAELALKGLFFLTELMLMQKPLAPGWQVHGTLSFVGVS